MGDRCYVNIAVGGEISSPKTLVKLAQVCCEWDSVNTQSYPKYLEWLVDAHCRGEPITVEQHEVNYGDTNDFNGQLDQLGMIYLKTTGAGGEYTGVNQWHHFDGPGSFFETYASADGEDLMQLSEAKMLLKAADVREALALWVTNAQRKCPPIKLTGKALEKCAPYIAKKALGIAA